MWHQACERRQVIISEDHLHVAQLTEEGIDKTVKTPLSVIQPCVFSDDFLLMHFQIWHKISNTLLLCVGVLLHHTTKFTVLCKTVGRYHVYHFENTQKIIMHCNTHICPNILVRITQDHYHTEDVTLLTTYRSDIVISVSLCSLSGTKAWSLKHNTTSMFWNFFKKYPITENWHYSWRVNSRL